MKKINALLVLLFFVTANQSFSQQLVANQGTINFFYFMNGEFVDNLHCESQVNGFFEIQLQNSVINDTVYIIYNGYSEQDTVINTTGNVMFNVGQSWTNSNILNSFSVSNGGMYFIPTYINKIIAHDDTLDLNNAFASMPATDPGCTYEEINGRFFIDNDFDCMYNTGDDGVNANVQVNSNYVNGQRTDYENTNSTGQFQDQLFKSDGFIDATFTIPSIYNFAYTIPSCSQAMYSVTALPATGINFARECAADIDLRTYANGVWPGARPLIPFNLYPKVTNIGCQAESGVLEVVLDPNVTYNAGTSSNPADYTTGNSLFWNYSNLTNVGTANAGYWNQFVGGISLTPNASVNIGDVLTFVIQTHTPSNDAFPANNSYQLNIPIVNSYDPNVKHVEPSGIGAEGYIPATTEKLIYTVDFQNTGNADAINVSIIDTLEGNVIPNSLKIISASHQMNPQWLSNSVLKFNFPQIHLPDSTTNEPESHGFVTFEIEMVQGLTPGTTIENTAYIYFDSNPAIITNTAKNTIEILSSLNELNSSVNGLEVIVYPNPMTETTTFSIQNEEVKAFSLELYDMAGKLVVQKVSDNSSQLTINKNTLEKGVYMYKIIDATTNKSSNGRLVIQ